MATAAEIELMLRAQTAQFTANMHEATNATTGVAVGITGVNQALELASKAIAMFRRAVRAAAEAVRFLVDQTADMDQIAKDARRVGLSGEEFFIWSTAAEAADLSVQTLTRSLGVMQRQLGTARLEEGRTRDAFERLGLDVNGLTGTSNTFRAAIEALRAEAARDPNVAARLGEDVFGRGYKELVPLIQDGAKAFDEWADILGEFDVDFAAAERFQDDLLQLRKQWQLMTMELTTQLLPAMIVTVELIQRLSQAISEMGPAFDDMRKQAPAFIRGFFGGLGAGSVGEAAGRGAELFNDMIDDMQEQLRNRRGLPDLTMPDPQERETRRKAVEAIRPVTAERGAFSEIMEIRRNRQAEDQRRMDQQRNRLLGDIAEAVRGQAPVELMPI